MATVALITSLGADVQSASLWKLGLALYCTVVVAMAVIAVTAAVKTDRGSFASGILRSVLPYAAILVFVVIYEVFLRPSFKAYWTNVLPGKPLSFITDIFLQYIPAGFVGLVMTALVVGACVVQRFGRDERRARMAASIVLWIGLIVVSVVPIALMGPFLGL
jgi:hypothetical protein